VHNETKFFASLSCVNVVETYFRNCSVPQSPEWLFRSCWLCGHVAFR